MAYRVPHGAAPASLIHCAPASLSFSFSSKPSLFPASEPLCVLFPVLEMLFSSRRRLIPQIQAEMSGLLRGPPGPSSIQTWPPVIVSWQAFGAVTIIFNYMLWLP